MDTINSPILSIPGISYRMGAMIIAEIGDFDRFDSADKILAYAGLSPSTYQSGQLDNCHPEMENVVLDIYDMRCLTPLSTSAIGIRRSMHTSPKSGLKESIIMLLYLMLPRNS